MSSQKTFVQSILVEAIKPGSKTLRVSNKTVLTNFTQTWDDQIRYPRTLFIIKIINEFLCPGHQKFSVNLNYQFSYITL